MAAWYDDLYLADKVVNQCLQKYNQLPKKGKPQKDVEWTLLAGILVAIESGLSLNFHNDLSQCMRFPTMRYVRPAKPQISLRICAV